MNRENVGREDTILANILGMRNSEVEEDDINEMSNDESNEIWETLLDEVNKVFIITDETSVLMEKKEPGEDIKDIDIFKDELDGHFENQYDEVKNIFTFGTNPLKKTKWKGVCKSKKKI